MLHHHVKFGRPLVATVRKSAGGPAFAALGDPSVRWYPEQSLPACRAHTTLHTSAPNTKEYIRVANIKSQEKRILTNERRRVRNKSVKSSLHTAVRGFRAAIAAGEKDKATELLVSTSRKLDKAVSKGVIHKNQAANKKSALAQALNQI
jgi:small subunit ribosomal protein S20